MDRFNGFTSDDFSIFKNDNLDETMTLIRNQIQPKFRLMGESITPIISKTINKELYLHIAKHMRRTVNPPKDTWFAIGGNKRGYKAMPHFQFGLFDDHAFIWLAFLYEIYNKEFISQTLKANSNLFSPLIKDKFILSTDHTKKGGEYLTNETLKEGIEKFNLVKKSDLLFGKIIEKDDPILKDEKKLIKFVTDVFLQMSDLYFLSTSQF